ncbi:hypothetical protein CSA37_05855 [Candidatus Fermentibacteria bacterium]|nr:MAG: hypothetical protein CSA37_05855 [Candidatus Fermentibacteria bacterium]
MDFLFFTRNTRYLYLTSVDFGSIHNCETGETLLSFDLGLHSDYGWTHCFHERISAGNDLRVISGDRDLRPPQTGRLYFNELFIDSQLYSSVEMENFQYQEVSPNGYFIDMQNYTPFIGGLWDGAAIPYTGAQFFL